mgnify:CR=1 FL=1
MIFLVGKIDTIENHMTSVRIKLVMMVLILEICKKKFRTQRQNEFFTNRKNAENAKILPVLFCHAYLSLERYESSKFKRVRKWSKSPVNYT